VGLGGPYFIMVKIRKFEVLGPGFREPWCALFYDIKNVVFLKWEE